LSIELGESFEIRVQVSWVHHVAICVTESSNGHRQSGEVIDTKVDAH